MVGMVVLTAEELSIVEGSFLGRDVIARFRMVDADEAWQQHLRSKAECGHIAHFLYLFVDFFILTSLTDTIVLM